MAITSSSSITLRVFGCSSFLFLFLTICCLQPHRSFYLTNDFTHHTVTPKWQQVHIVRNSQTRQQILNPKGDQPSVNCMPITNEVRSDHHSSSQGRNRQRPVLDMRKISSQLLLRQWMPDDPTPLIQNEAVVPEARAGEERLQIVDLVFLSLGHRHRCSPDVREVTQLGCLLCGSTHERLPCSSGPPI